MCVGRVLAYGRVRIVDVWMGCGHTGAKGGVGAYVCGCIGGLLGSHAVGVLPFEFSWAVGGRMCLRSKSLESVSF